MYLLALIPLDRVCRRLLGSLSYQSAACRPNAVSAATGIEHAVLQEGSLCGTPVKLDGYKIFTM
jgi:hypothetical protein